MSQTPEKSVDFIPYILYALNSLSGGEVGKAFPISRVDEKVIVDGKLNREQFGKQDVTGRYMLDVFLQGARSSLKTNKGTKWVSFSEDSMALTEEGLKEAHAICDKLVNQNAEEPMSIEQKLAAAQKAEEARLLAESEARSESQVEEDDLKAGRAVEFMGVVFPRYNNVPELDCLPMPEHYGQPTSGDSLTQLKEMAIALRNRRSAFVHGQSGAGKDAFFHAFSATTRHPAKIFTISPQEDIQAWISVRSFSKDSTSWEEGELFKAVRYGYTTPDGKTLPYMILLSDFDRATRHQGEILRLIMDSIQGRIMGPDGKNYPVFPGTLLVATSNTAGGGNTNGRFVSSNPLDASIMNRFQRKFRFPMLDWVDEKQILEKKFPIFSRKMEAAWEPVGNCVKVLRLATNSAAETSSPLYAEFGHRDVCNWLGHTEDILRQEFRSTGTVAAKEEVNSLLRRSAQTLLDSMPDDDTRMAACRLMDAYLGGMLPKKK